MPALARLRFLSAAEIPFRVRERWVLATDRWWRPPRTPDLPLPPWSDPGPRWTPPPPSDDPRDRWEHTRLQHASADEVLRWVAAHPPGHGIGWAVAMEVALRLVSLVRVATPDPAFRRAVAAHAAWIARHPSRGSSANNHRVAELGALALAARVLDVPQPQVEELPDVLEAQVHPDGVGVEQSPTYLAYDLEWALLARRCGVRGLDGTLDRAARFLWTLLDRGGHVPAIGDDDGGRVFAVAPPPEDRYVLSVTGAVRAELGAPVPAAWTPDARSRHVTLPAAPGSACFSIGGLTVLRRGALEVVFDHGPLGGSTLAAHGHADALSVWIHVDGRPVVVSRGTGRYNGDPLGRRFHRGTSANPTGVLDGRDQSTPHDHPFLWRTRAETVLEHVDLGRTTVTACCDGVHRRTVELADGAVIVTDRWLGDGRHHVALGFPLAPSLTLRDLAVYDGDRRVGRWIPDPSLRVRVVTGGARPGVGWHSPSYGVWTEATTLSLESHVRLPIVVRTSFVLG